MVQNQVLDVFRKASRDKALMQKIMHNITELRTEPANTLLERELRKVYNEAIENLPPQRKIIYLLNRDHELTYDQIAEKLNLSRNTVRNQMVEAIRSIRDHVGRHKGFACLIVSICLFEKIIFQPDSTIIFGVRYKLWCFIKLFA